jgi:hypothetical protein
MYEDYLSSLREWVKERFNAYKERAEHVPGQAKAPSPPGPPLLLLYGSETGVTQDLAYRTADAARARGMVVTVKECNEVRETTLETSGEDVKPHSKRVEKM